MSGTTGNSDINDLRNQLDMLRASDPAPAVEAAKQKASATVADVKAQAVDLAAQAANKAADAAEAVAQPVRDGVEKARAAVQGARQTVADVSSDVQAQTDSLVAQIRGAPIVSLGVAALAGYMIGRIVR